MFAEWRPPARHRRRGNDCCLSQSTRLLGAGDHNRSALRFCCVQRALRMQAAVRQVDLVDWHVDMAQRAFDGVDVAIGTHQ